jgi:peptidoglycan/LPS O-acetylase OafA/YrhL
MILSLLACIILAPTTLNFCSELFNSKWPSIYPINLIFIFKTLILTPSNPLDGVVWSLTYELVISILFLPIIASFLSKSPLYLTVIVSVIFIFNLLHPAQHFLSAMIYYSIFFALGAILTNYKNIFFANKLYMLPIYWILYTNIFWINSMHITLPTNSFTLTDFISGLGATGIIFIVVSNSSVNNILRTTIFTFYGKISYSFYLMHLPILYICIWELHEYKPVITSVLVIFLTTVCSYFSYKYIELPFIQYSKNLVKQDI